MQLLVIGNLNSEIAKSIEIIKKSNSSVFLETSIDSALNSIRNGRSADIILIDALLDIKFLKTSLENERISSNIVAYGLNTSPKDAVKSIKDGAKEFIPLPPDEELIASILETISQTNKKFIYRSNLMEKIVEIADKISKSDANILITGKSGTGKEVIANYIHKSSNRSKKNFIRVNCAAIPENLLESELFGHEKGAFTGAIAKRIGKFEESSGGTLLLDEISEMDVRLQAKLLRAIQEKEIDRVGGNHPIKVDLRIIATSNRDLEDEVKKGNFREDLFFRLNIINIVMPELKERREDIILLSNYFIEKYCKNNNLETKKLDQESIDVLYNYDWPGNIRELENTIHRSVLLSTGNVINKDHLMIKEVTKNNYSKDNYSEKKLILNTLNYCLGDMNQAANILGISISKLTEKLVNTNV